MVYSPIFYGVVRLSFMVSELFLYLFAMNFTMYFYYYLINKSIVSKTKSLVIYGAGHAGLQLESEFKNTKYKVTYFIDDDEKIQNRSIDSIQVISQDILKEKIGENKYDLLIIAIPSASKDIIKAIYDNLSEYFQVIKILPSVSNILQDKEFSMQLEDVSVEDLLARYPKDLDKETISSFIKNKTILITGAGGSIGSEICKQCEKFGAKKLILLDHSEYSLYSISEEIKSVETVLVMKSVVNKDSVAKTFEDYSPNIVIHAAAYKHVPLVEANIDDAILNNVIGTKNIIDLSIEYNVDKFIMISTDKAVRPTNVMGTTKRICELYAQNSNTNGTDIVAVRFGNVLGSVEVLFQNLNLR